MDNTRRALVAISALAAVAGIAAARDNAAPPDEAATEARIRALLKRHWEYAASDQDITHEIYQDDAVLEFPQSQERFVGRENFKAWRKIYPAKLAFKVRRLRGAGALWVGETSISYDGGPWQFGCSVLEFRGDRVARETLYISEGWKAPDWRAPWRSPWVAES